MAAMFPDHNIWLQDVTQSYVKWRYLQRDAYFKPADQFNIPQDTCLKLLKTLCGISELGALGFININYS